MYNISNFDYFKFIAKNLHFELIHINHVELGNEWNYENVSSPFNRIYFILEGSGTILSDTQKVDLLAGNVYLIPANSVFNYQCNNRLNKIFVHFNLSIVPGKDIFSHIDNCVSYSVGLSVIDHIKELLYSNKLSDSVECQSLILNIISKFINSFGNELINEINLYSKYYKVYSYVKQNYSASLSTKQVCEFAGFSTDYLTRKFKIDNGMTMKEYIDSVLIENLKKELLFSNKSIKDISYCLGFNNEFYCSRFFKRHTGISPRGFRNKVKVM